MRPDSEIAGERMIASFLDMMFGCVHERTTFPQTQKKPLRTYIVCLSCGREFPYSWEEMKVKGESDAELIPDCRAVRADLP